VESLATINGIVNVDKPAGMTSHDVVGRMRRIAGTKRVGHTGTLDPMATGVLVVCLGVATRLADFLADQGKVYVAGFALGAATSTEDSTGELVGSADASHITDQIVRTALTAFEGRIDQIPPMVSAVHHDGKRLYELARQGITVERRARTIVVNSIQLIDFKPGVLATGTMEIACGKGAYVRTICADLGAALGVGGHMNSLRRMAVGRFTAKTAVSLETLAETGVDSYLVSPSDAMDFLPAHITTEAEAEDIGHGRAIAARGLGEPGKWIRVVDSAGTLIAMGMVSDDAATIQPSKVLRG